MKLSIISLCLFTLFSCHSNLSQETKEKIKEKETFWKVRTQTIYKNKNTMEYPIKKDASLTEQRTNRIYLRSNHCQFEVFVDDVLLYKMMGESTKNGGGINGDQDINQLLLTSGTHEIKVRLYPQYGKSVFGEGGGMGLTFSYFKNRDLSTMEYNLGMRGADGIDLNQSNEQWVSDKGEVGTSDYIEAHYEPKTPLPLKGLPVYEWRSTFDSQVNFDKVGWRNSLNLKKEQDDEKKDIRTELLKEYQKIHEMIAKKDITSYFALIKESEELVTSSLHYRENEKEIRYDDFTKLLKNDDYEVEPLFEETFQLEYQGYGKLVMFLNKADGEGIIRLKNKKNPNENVYLDFRFQRKGKGGKLTVI
ncbi:hypothetical protein FNW52_19505 [Flavobacterium sp. ZT3R18]|uniref:hypothetical protein n=1 Tax=Flavobacterium sp. ZT3R18 TaxID=2594429 RepID=UPI00117A58C2|nr:hypothetical protein [Flavobacterium sp. ZT3R18]TRX30902.1 hypothetical protein FNW52_19505 [Flavobacterium sp. ZT3R18]